METVDNIVEHISGVKAALETLASGERLLPLAEDDPKMALVDKIAETVPLAILIESLNQRYYKCTPPAETSGYTFDECAYGIARAVEQRSAFLSEALDAVTRTAAAVIDRNATIEKLQKTIKGMASDLSAARGELVAMTAEHDQISTRLSGANSELNAARNEITKLQANYQALQAENRKLVDLAKKEEKRAAVAKKEQAREARRDKRNATKDKEREARITRLENEVRQYREEKAANELTIKVLRKDMATVSEALAQSKLTTIYSQEGEALLIFPYRLTVQVDGVKVPQPQMSLLYSNGRGLWRAVTLDADHEVSFGKLHQNGTEYSAKTVALANKILCSPSERVVRIAQEWLYKVNVKQRGAFCPEDFDIATFEDRI